ncbi:MAG: glycosyltransferase family 2 protein [Acidobacteria bacterium]|nr:glycosyltransferase family 2 protein [Acidobacteriota bacterium]
MRLSLIVPVYNSAAYLRQCLNHIRQCEVAPHEILVVDDGSTDESPQVAREFGVRLISNGGRKGPAAARNLGAREATGDILFFIDADVCVRHRTIGDVIAAFEDDASLDALIGSYDDAPAHPDFLSRYRNLMHHFVHQRGRREASTFWSGCGAIRRDLFLKHSGFDTTYKRPAIEDIELGYRLKSAGCKLMLDDSIQVTHLKRWTFWGLVKTDVLDRGIPWTELILRDNRMPDDLNLQISQRVSVALVYLILLAALFNTFWLRAEFLAPFFCLLFFALNRYWVDRGNRRSKTVNVVMALSIVALGALSYVSRQLALIPFLAFALPLLFMRHRYEIVAEKRSLFGRLILGVYTAAAILCCVAYAPRHPVVALLFILLAVVILLNNQFYLFLAARQGRTFAIAAIPFHILYHFYNGISFTVGLSRHLWRTLWNRRSAHEARAMGNGR